LVVRREDAAIEDLKRRFEQWRATALKYHRQLEGGDVDLRRRKKRYLPTASSGALSAQAFASMTGMTCIS
jgi:hypothetical protein